MKKTVLLRGPFVTRSGYGVHALQIARYALSRQDWDCKFLLTPWGQTPWIVDMDAQCGLIGEVLKRSISAPVPADLSIQVQLPNEWAVLAKKNIGVTAGVETDRCNPAWIASLNQMDAIIVPSTFTKRTFEATGKVDKPLVVVPEAFHDSCKNPVEGNFSFETSFNFLIFGQITGNHQLNERKNTFSTVKWLCEVFKDDPAVGIVIKTNMGRNSQMDLQMTTNILKQLLTEVRKGPYPRLHLLHGEMSDAEVASLYVDPSMKALVTATRGEGYGLPILEAATAGLPVIATNWSGHLDFMNKGKFIPLDYQLQPVHASRVDNTIFMPGVKWAEVNEVDFKQRVSKFRKSHSTPKQWADELRLKLLESHSFEAIAKSYDEFFKDF